VSILKSTVCNRDNIISVTYPTFTVHFEDSIESLLHTANVKIG